MKRTMNILGVVAISMCLFGCSSNEEKDTSSLPITSSSLFEIDNEQIVSEIFNFPFDYDLNVPGNEKSYYLLWTGLENEKSVGESLYSTCLTSYGHTIDDYYLIYISIDKLENFDKWFLDYSNNSFRSAPLFSENKDIIDGKKLLYAQYKNLSDITIYRNNNYKNAPRNVSGKELVACLQAKNLLIEENISQAKSLNKNMTLLCNKIITYQEESNSYIDCSESNNDYKYNFNLFSFEGKKIETFYGSYENMDFCYCPYIGLLNHPFVKTKSAELQGDNIVLPRYTYQNGEKIDYLDENFNPSSLYYPVDIFYDFKADFLEAYVSDLSIVNDSNGNPKSQDALFDYEKVAEIISKNYKN